MPRTRSNNRTMEQLRAQLKEEVRALLQDELTPIVKNELHQELYEEVRETMRVELSDRVREEVTQDIREMVMQEEREKVRKDMDHLRETLTKKLVAEITESRQKHELHAVKQRMMVRPKPMPSRTSSSGQHFQKRHVKFRSQTGSRRLQTR